jgi:protocatechuate 3,4-dioxygenase beta subunit
MLFCKSNYLNNLSQSVVEQKARQKSIYQFFVGRDLSRQKGRVNFKTYKTVSKPSRQTNNESRFSKHCHAFVKAVVS